MRVPCKFKRGWVSVVPTTTVVAVAVAVAVAVKNMKIGPSACSILYASQMGPGDSFFAVSSPVLHNLST